MTTVTRQHLEIADRLEEILDEIKSLTKEAERLLRKPPDLVLVVGKLVGPDNPGRSHYTGPVVT